ncbi:MAG TPA: dTDP-4-dehydrorhamnose reductase [Candidatus Acidoferrales bacterium]|nr:dTDP-4-dehydrorhamnose reductase [Candidatus Acidoferrales bacterium]
MTPRILLTGKNGQVGSELAQLLPRLGEVTALGRQELDLSNIHDIRQAIQEVRPSLIVNAAAYTAVDRAEKEEALARAINSDAPAVIAEEAKKIGAALVHYSTDYVFDGTKRTPYSEDDPTNPISAYGRTKLAGEEAIRAAGIPHLIFRTAWVYATSGKNFLLTILRLAAEREELRIVSDQFGAPTSSREIAQATTRVFAPRISDVGAGLRPARPQNVDPAGFLADLAGTYNMTASGETTWHEFATTILEDCSQLPRDLPWFAAATGNRPLIAKRVIPITTADYPTPARRPVYSVLSNTRFAATFGFTLLAWRTQLTSALKG